MPFRTVDGETHLCLVTVDPDTSEETITFVFDGGDGTSKETAVQVTTFRQLLDADADTDMHQKYIQVMNDINIADESWYGGSTNKSTYRNNIFATTPKNIVGIVAKGEYLITATSSDHASFENINFVNWVFKPNVSGSRAFFGTTSVPGADYLELYNCSFSIRFSPINYKSGTSSAYVFGTNLKSTNVSIYIEADKSAAYYRLQPFFNGVRHSKINMVINGAKILIPATCFHSLVSTSMFFKNCEVTGTSASSSSTTSGSQIYYAFSNCTFNNAPYTQFCSSVNIIACDTTPLPYQPSSYSGNSLVFATLVDEDDPTFTTSSIKSKQFLISCGFLP